MNTGLLPMVQLLPNERSIVRQIVPTLHPQEIPGGSPARGVLL